MHEKSCSQRKKIKKITEKLVNRTKKMQMQWPKDGLFELSWCEEISTLIKKYKSKYQSGKREEEMEIVSLLKKEGEEFLKSVMKIREELKKGEEKNQKKMRDILNEPPQNTPLVNSQW